MKIDIYAHIMPEKYLNAFSKVLPEVSENREARTPANVNLEMRLRLMGRYPDVLQVLTISNPPLDTSVKPKEARELARIANDELAELVVKHPDKFIAGVACLPLNDMDAALEETERAITQLGLKGVQLFARAFGEQLDDPKFRPLYEKMVKYNLPMWIHPDSDATLDEPLFGWPFATATAMRRLVMSGIFQDFPNIKFIVHHCGTMIPYFEGRIKWLFPNRFKMGDPGRGWGEHFKNFYTDTATYGSTPALMCGYAYLGGDHLLFGTDAPLGPQFGLTLETISSIERMKISEADKEKIFSQNAIKLLGIAT